MDNQKIAAFLLSLREERHLTQSQVGGGNRSIQPHSLQLGGR
ncbi:MAG: hypothetical protein Q4F15_01370 [Bacillota bacterium]|nr:hypothetical protein [Bacillota bacterium]